MKFVCLSDTHFLHERVVIPDGDILIHAGDITRTGDPEEIVEFDAFLGELPHRHKIVIAGNHDYYFEARPAAAKKLFKNSIYIEDSEVTVEGVRIYGSPWTPWFNDWAFNLPRGKALQEKWNQIPQGVQILVTHGPPIGQCDRAVTERGPSSVGCEELMSAVRRVKPVFHVFGHVHSGYGKSSEGGTTFVNASICNEAYEPVNPPIVFEWSPVVRRRDESVGT